MKLLAIANAYGISPTTIYQWKKRAGIELEDFSDPSLVAKKLAHSAINRSPRLEKLTEKKTQLAISFRLGIAGINQPKK
jgi:uncharacterized protein YjcR